MNLAVYALAMNVLRRCWPPYTLILALICLIVIRYSVKRYAFVKSLSWIPGPAALPILGNALSLTGGQTEFFKLLQKYSKEYGPIFKLWVGMRPFVFITSAEYAQPILSSMVHIEKSYEYKFLYPWLGTGLVTSSGSKWHQRRKLLTPTFHYSILEDFIEPIVKQSHILIKSLSRRADGPDFNVMTYNKLCALDVICVTAMGKCVNAQLNEDHKYVKAVDGMNEILQRRFITPWLKPDFLFNRSHWGKKQEEHIRVIQDFVGDVVKEKRDNIKYDDSQGKRRRRPLLDLVLAVAENEKTMTDEDVRDEVNTFMFAGHDTTSVALSWSLYVLGKHPDVQEKIISEYENAVKGEIPTFSELQGLEYLESCIKEVLRLYPVVPIIARDIKQDVVFSKTENIAPGVTTLIFTPSLHRDPIYFQSPHEFNPERFVGWNKEAKNPFTYVPFSAGPRNCIGSKFAMIELKIVLHAILKNYIVLSPVPEEELNLYSEIVLMNEGGIPIQLKKRPSYNNNNDT